MTKSNPSVGPISDSTRTDIQSLASDFAFTIRKLCANDRDRGRCKAANEALKQYDNAEQEFDNDSSPLEEFVDSIAREVLESYCAPYMGFYENEDGLFGFWPDLESLQDDALSREGVARVNAGDPWPPLWPPHGNQIQFVMEVTDHGNVTLFNRRRVEIWSCV